MQVLQQAVHQELQSTYP
ncbi:unnamed protein product [Acanthoscelides obtectus]|uniref:Uncharacterized protein n=1 Tax=Acanthoscelides obtectus TaxID=200917 RepID=A0A9P0KGE6_ACAOB|nr:unnamed protein product [Acanthoscelides obtectus]CAK1631754.1 hypothetical protein AOBTE_LOCUS7133 [Acanthoscelides obtectus]